MPIDPTQVTVQDLTGSEEEEEETPTDEEEDITDDVPDDPSELEEEEEETPDPEDEEEKEQPDDEEEPDSESDEDDEDEDEDAGENDEPEVSLYDQLEMELGLDLPEDAEYEDTVDGFAEFAEDVVQQKTEQQWNQVFEQYPDIQQYVQFRMQGGDPDEYQEAFFDTTWQDTSVPEEDPDQQKQIIRQNLSEDFDDEEVNEMISEYEAAGVLETKAKESLRQLQKQEEQQQEELLEKQEDQAREQQRKVQEYWDNVEQTINEQDEFHGIPVPKGEKDDFFAFMAEDVTGDGVSRRDQMLQEMELEDRLAVDLILYYDFDLDQLAEMKAKSKSAQSLQDRLKSSKSRADVTDEQSNDVNDSNEVNPDDIPNPTELLG